MISQEKKLSQWKNIPGVKDFRAEKISQWSSAVGEIFCWQDFPVGKNNRLEFPEVFPCCKNPLVEELTVDEQLRISYFSMGGKVSRWEGGENFHT